MASSHVPEPDNAPEAASFVEDTEVRPAGPGRYEAAIPDDWRIVYAFGGMSMAIGLRAVQADLARPDLTLLSASATFCSPVDCGPLDIHTQTLRNGRTAAQGTAVVRNTGNADVGVHVTGTYGELRDESISFVDVEYPEGAGRPDDHEPPPPRAPGDPFEGLDFHRQTEWRPVGPIWWANDDWTRSGAAFCSWFRLLRTPSTADGVIDPLSLCLPADVMGPAIAQWAGPDASPFFVLTLEIGMHVYAQTESPWILQHCRAPQAGDGYAASVVELWDPDQRLLALATQRARLREIRPGDGFFG